MKLNLRNRILLPTAGLIFLTLVATGFVSYNRSATALDHASDALMSQICHSNLAQVETWIEDQQFLLQQWALQPQMLAALDPGEGGAASRVTLNALFAEAQHANPAFEAMHLFNAQGIAVASSLPAAIGKLNVTERHYFADVAAGKPILSHVLKSLATGNAIVAVAHPVRDGSGVRGFVLISLDLSNLSRQMQARTKFLETGYAFMVDDLGVFVTHPNPELILKTKLDDFDWGRQIAQARNGELYYTYGGVEKMAQFVTSEKLHWSLVTTAPVAEVTAPARHMARLTALIGLGALAVAVAALILIARSISNPILAIAGTLHAASAETEAAAGQVSTSSQAVAQGASEQAASLEETSASLEEMSSMTRSNAENTGKANDLAKQARSAADCGSSEMQAMTNAMQAIKKSSDDVANIIKTIDEIAFQTNILALNAAVEAARAGEAGAGFAVVAEEVRALAQRSATAAKETTAKIEDSIGKTTQGVQISGRVAKNLKEIVDRVHQLDGLITAVASASREQNEGVKQITIAVSQMDKITQSNAANAEETAAAAEELNAQSLALNEATGRLRSLVDGQAASAPVPAGPRSTPGGRAATRTPSAPVLAG